MRGSDKSPITALFSRASLVRVEPITRERAIKLIVAILIAVLLPGVIVSFLAQLSSFLGITMGGPIPDIGAIIQDLNAFSEQIGFLLVVGFCLGIILAFKADDIPKVDTVAWYIHMVSHELVHAILARLCGYRIREFKFTRHGGYVAYSKPNARGNILITLGPYLFPLIPILLTLLAAIFRGWPQGILVFVLGVSLGSHLAGTAEEALIQYDVRQAGLFLSLVLILSTNLMLLSLVMSIVSPGRISFTGFLESSWELDLWYFRWLLGLFIRG
jgi:hypothetical protein